MVARSPRTHATARQPSAVASINGAFNGLGEGTAVGHSLLAGFLAWAGIGWLVDRWLGTEPWLFVAGAVLGIVAGTYLTLLAARRIDAREAPQRAEPGRSRPHQAHAVTTLAGQGEAR